MKPSTRVGRSRLVALGRKIRTHRQDLGLSLREFASLAGVSYTTVFRLEKGQEIELSAYLKLDETYGQIK